ncbi:MAG: hypothetical protein OEM62_09220 [Acidobacteriota bacterium]|nr:hypothetical protein [Acidobacteriota bacterium]
MRRMTPIPVLALILLLCPQDAATAQRGAATAIQASRGDASVVLLSGKRRAHVLSERGDRHVVRLRRGEQLMTVEQIDGGLVAAGIRHRDGQSTLFVLQSDRSGTRRLPSLPARAPLRVRPVLLVERGELVAAAWLEGPGPRQLRVKAADWNGIDWGPVATVSAPSPGSQTGLTGLVLEDGSTLLVWSQFDGHDDDILFSWRQKTTWSDPQRVLPNNALPDVTPSLGLSRGGAILSWSRFDGTDYRLWTASFRRGEWQHSRLIGEPGSLFPQVINRAGATYIVYRTAVPGGWTIRRMTASGDSDRRAFVAAASSDRPVLSSVDDTTVTLSWPQHGRKVEARLEARP